MASRRLLPDASVPGADLPVRPALHDVVAALNEHGTAVLVAPPGSGKTSLLPLALADTFDGRIVVAEPRRLATRAAAHRLAALAGEEPGRSIGYAMRGERAGGRDVRVEVVTTGLLIQRLQRDPELPGVSAVVIDECHERHLDADLALAFCVDVRGTLRDDLKVVATSATPNIAAMTVALGSNEPAPVVEADAAQYDVRTIWAPPPVPLPPGARVDRRLLVHVAEVTRRALTDGEGDVLVFVPGEAEIGIVAGLLTDAAEVVPLFGRQSRAEQQRAFASSARRRVVITTSVAESSLTVPGVRAVVDAGLARQPRLDPARGLTALVTTRVSRASADQRAGRAGRQGPGRAYRCWSQADHVHLAAQTPPEIATTDLAGFALTVAAWGAPGGEGLALLDAPPAPALAAAQELLRGLDAVDAHGRITGRGRRLAEVGTHPRLARALLDGADLVGAERADEVVALLSDDSLAGRGDDLPARLRELRAGRDRAATARWREEITRLRRSTPAGATRSRHVTDDLAVGTVVGLAYPDRVARARNPDSVAYLTSAGTGAALPEGSGLRGTAWLAIAVADRPLGRTDARIRSAAPIDEATARLVAADLVRTEDEIGWHDGGLVARRVESLGAVELSAAPLADPDPLRVLAAVRDGIARTGLDVLTWSDAARSLRERLAFCHAWLGGPWPAVDDDALLGAINAWLGPDLTRVRRTRDLARIDVTSALRRLLPWPAASRLDELAPERLTVPSGSRVRVTYDGTEAPVVAVKLQETFGWTATPAFADGRVPVVLHLLSPAGRTVAVTADLASFWRQGYLQVRSELRARYPKHPWPEDPLTAVPTARTRRR